MAKTKTTLLFAFLCFALILEYHTYGQYLSMEIQSGGNFMINAQQIDCGSKCQYRCSKASRHKMCIRACNTCCHRCNCVPPGTSGNEDVCPCYANMTTHGGRHKCP